MFPSTKYPIFLYLSSILTTLCGSDHLTCLLLAPGGASPLLTAQCIVPPNLILAAHKEEAIQIINMSFSLFLPIHYSKMIRRRMQLNIKQTLW